MAKNITHNLSILKDLSEKSDSGSNLITIGDGGTFEADRSTWGISDSDNFTITRSTSFVSSGTYSADITANRVIVTITTSGLNVIPLNSISVLTGNYYQLRVKVSGNSDNPISSNNAYIRIYPDTFSGFDILNQKVVRVGDLSSSTSLQEVSILIKATSDVSIDFNLQLYDSGIGDTLNLFADGKLHIDDLFCYQQSVTYPDFLQGRSVILTYDDSTQVFAAENSSGTAIISGPILFMYREDEVAIDPPFDANNESVSSYKICEGSDLAEFIVKKEAVSFSYSEKKITTNGCAAATCSLIITDVVKVNPSVGQNDGSITVTAEYLDNIITKTDIEYGIGDFNYGAGHTSSTISNLGAGTYNIFAVDSDNCKASVQVILSEGNIAGYGVKYRLGYKDLNGNSMRFDILQKNKSDGIFTEETSAGVPVVYTQNETDQFDIFKEPIKASYINLTIPEETKFKYKELYTNNTREYLGIHYKDTGAGFTELWRGFLEPAVFNANYSFLPYLEFSFIDGLAELEDDKYKDGQRYYNDLSILDIIVSCLRETDLELPIRIACNIYEDSHLSGVNDDPFTQTFLDQELFYDDDKEAKDCKEVLEIVLKAFGCRLDQWGGFWWIRRIEECKDVFAYREFSKTGAYVTNGTYDPIKEIRRSCVTDARAVFASGATLEVLRPAKNLIITNTFATRPSILENYDFSITNTSGGALFWSNDFGDGSFNATVITVGGDSILRLDNGTNSTNGRNSDAIKAVQKRIEFISGDQIRVKFDFAVDYYDDRLPWLDLGFKLKIGGSYLNTQREWTSTESKVGWYPTPSKGFMTFDETFDLPFDEESVSGSKVDTTLDFWIHNYNTKDVTFGNFFNETLGLSEMQSSDGLTTPAGTKVSLYDKETETVGPLTITRKGIIFYEYVISDRPVVENVPDIVIPDNVESDAIYSFSFGVAYYKLEKIVPISLDYSGYNNPPNLQYNRYCYIKNAEITVLPQGQDIVEEQLLTVENIEPGATEDYEYEIEASDLPEFDTSSLKYMSNSFFKLFSGENTRNWTRTGVSESTTLQQILAKTFLRQYSTATFKISGDLLTQGDTHLDITPLDALIETADEGKVYYINGITIDHKNLIHTVNLVHTKSTKAFGAAAGCGESGGNDDDGGTGNAFEGSFDGSFGTAFDTIFN